MDPTAHPGGKLLRPRFKWAQPAVYSGDLSRPCRLVQAYCRACNLQLWRMLRADLPASSIRCPQCDSSEQVSALEQVDA